MMKFLMGTAALSMAVLTAPDALGQAEPLVGQITPTAATFCPQGWHEADGSIMAISQNDALYSLFGTMYGGDGRTTFALPDLRGRAVGGQGQGPGLTFRTQGAPYGAPQVTLTTAHMPNHNHPFRGSTSAASQSSIGNATLATFPAARAAYAANSNVSQALNVNAIYSTGNGLPTNVQQPFNTVRWCVAMYGTYPSRN